MAGWQGTSHSHVPAEGAGAMVKTGTTSRRPNSVKGPGLLASCVILSGCHRPALRGWRVCQDKAEAEAPEKRGLALAAAAAAHVAAAAAMGQVADVEVVRASHCS